MKINKLLLKNINSLKGEHLIAFNQPPLSTTGLFAITGATGSGKSTLLDAISLAIYNEIPRSGKLSKKSIDTFGSILNRDCKSCFAEVEYQVKGINYRSKWSIELNRNGNLNDYKMELSQQNEKGEWILSGLKRSEIPKRNHKIIGLNYEQFIKSIVLSQGDFAKFLKADEKERAEILEKITGTEIYREIGRAVFEKQRQEKHILDTHTAKLDGITLLDKDVIKEKKDEIKGIEEQLELLNSKHKTLTDQIKTKVEIETKLKNKIAINKDLELLQQQIKAEQPNFIRLQNHNKLLNISNVLYRIIDLQKEIIALQQQVENLENNIQQSQKDIAKYHQQKEEEEKAVAKIEKTQIDSEKIFTTVIQLDEKIAGIEKQLVAQKDNLKKQQKIYDDKQEKLIADKKQLDNDNRHIKELEQQIISDKAVEEIQQIIPLVKSKAEEYTSTKNSYGKSIKKLDNNELIERLKANESWQKKVAFVSDYIEHNKNLIVENNQQLKILKINSREDLSHLREAIQKKLFVLNELQQLQKSHIERTKELEHNQKILQKLQAEIPPKKKYLQELKTKILIGEKKEEELTIRAERLRLEASLTDKRKQLKEHEPCPLCGATHHPYAEKYNESSATAESELEQVKNLLLQQRKEKDQEEKQIIKLQEREENTTVTVKDLKLSISNLNNDFEQKKQDLELTIISNLQAKLNQLEVEKEVLIKGEKLLAKVDSNRNEVLILEPILEQLKNLQLLQSSITEVLQPVTKWIVKGSKIEAIIATLETVFNAYNHKKKELEKLQIASVKLTTKIDSDSNELSVKTKELEQLKNIISEIEKQLNIEIGQRKQLFGEENPIQKREELNLKANSAKEQLSKSKEHLTKLNTACKHYQKQFDEEQKKLKEKNNLLNEQQNSAIPRLELLGYNSVELALQNILKEEVANAIIQKKEKLETLQTTLNERKRTNNKELQHLQQQESEKSHNELIVIQQEQNQQIKEYQQKIGALNQLLKEDKQRKQQQKTLLATIEQQQREFHKWDKLNELIGDATGSKYSKFAQELTLLQLLSIANRHLKKLNNRYLLKHNSDIAQDLFVVDLLQGNEERSVRTLSGGESFLIALALALALSDLAGKNTRIESLFIDEGFGSLDQETLDMALSTLEQLQSETNRTIGVISHVEALKERITTQIVLEKNQMGNSTIRVEMR